MRGLVQQMTFISPWSNERPEKRNSLGLDLKHTTKLIFEMERIMLFNLNQFKRMVHLLLRGLGTISQTLAPFSPHSQLVKS